MYSAIKPAILATALIAGGLTATAFENVDFTRVAEQTVDKVVSVKKYVNVQQRQGVNSQYYDPFADDPFFRYFFGLPPQQQQPRQPKTPEPKQQEPQSRQAGLGSGVILSTDGYIVTNNHVIEGADRVEVSLNDNRTFDARVIGADATTDLALIQIDAEGLEAITVGDSDALKVGEWVVAVGNPFGFTSSVTTGIVSAKARGISTGSGRRGLDSFIQTDAAVNPGNSGGALVNLNGELVGINSAIYSQTGNYAGASFAIPTSVMKKVVDDLLKYGAVQRAVLGITYSELNAALAKEKGITATAQGLYIGSVAEGSAAAEGGLQEGDVIVSINSHRALTSGQLQEILATLRPGDHADIGIIRDNQSKVVGITLRNDRGDTAVTRRGEVADLGAVFAEVDAEKCKELKIRSGLQVKELSDGKFKSAGMRPGFIIVDVNNVYVTKPEEMTRLYKSITESDEYDHVMFISGVYPNSPKKVYYAVDLAD